MAYNVILPFSFKKLNVICAPASVICYISPLSHARYGGFPFLYSLLNGHNSLTYNMKEKSLNWNWISQYRRCNEKKVIN